MQGIGYGFTIDEILNGKAKSASSIEWEGIRGGSENVLFKQKKSVAAFKLDVRLQDKESPSTYPDNDCNKNRQPILNELTEKLRNKGYKITCVAAAEEVEHGFYRHTKIKLKLIGK